MFNDDNHREFQRGIDPQAGKTKRHEERLNLRRQIRSGHLNKRRKELTKETDNETTTNNNESEQISIATKTIPEEVVPSWVHINNLDMFVEQINSKDINDVLQSVQAIRQLLSVPTNPPIDKIFDSGVIKQLLGIAAKKFEIKDSANITPLEEKQIKLQFEASWALTNIASGDSTFTRRLVDMGCIDALVRLLQNTQDNETIDQTIWCLGNIAGDCWSLRDKVLQSGVLQFMIEKLSSFPEDMKRNTVWTISNFCRGKPPPDWNTISKVLGPLTILLQETRDYEVTVDILWAISFLSEDREENVENEDNANNHYQVEAVIETGIMEYILSLLKHARLLSQQAWSEIDELKKQLANKNPSGEIAIPQSVRQKLTTSDFLIAPCVRIMGNVVSGNDEQTLEVVKAGFFDVIDTCLDHRVKNIKKESCWALSNVVAGLPEHAEEFFKRENLVKKVIDLCLHDDINVRKEAGWCLSNAICSSTFEQTRILVNNGFIEAMVSLLDFDAEKVLMMAMEALIECFTTYNKHFGKPENCFNEWVAKMEELDGMDRLEKIQDLDKCSNECYQLAAAFVSRFWPENDGLEQDDPMTEQNNDQNFFSEAPEPENDKEPYQF